MRVVRADRSHLASLVPLFDAYRRFYRKPSNVAGARAFLDARLSAGDSVVFVAETDGDAVGFTQLYPLYSSVRMRRVWLLNDLFVASGARRQGVAESLMEAARVFASADGAAAIQLATEWDNHGARALYERLGYQRDTEFAAYELTL